MEYNKAAGAHSLAKQKFSWAYVTELVEDLYEKVKFDPYLFPKQTEYKTIVGISRGGLIPAVMLSHMLGIRNFHTITCQSYDDENKQSVMRSNIQWEAHVALLASDTLIVDDIIDTGATFQYLHKLYPHPAMCALISKIETKHIHVGRITQDMWIDFPWETKK